MIPRWLHTWFKGNDTGLSSRTIAWILSGNVEAGECAMESWGWHAPSDTSDVGRCVRLLDLAAANGEDWRARLNEVAALAKAWRPLVPRWADIEAAYRWDVEAQTAHRAAAFVSPKGRRLSRARKDIPFPPSHCWHIVSVLDGSGDPYAGRDVPWQREVA